MNASRWTLAGLAAAALGGLSTLAIAQDDPRPAADKSKESIRVSHNDSDFAMARRWQKATDLMGKSVTNNAKQDLGRIEDIVVDANSGRILYGVLSFGGVMGVGDKLFAIPWSSLRLTDDYKSFEFSATKAQLEEAQGFDKEQWPNFADETWNTKTYKTYNQTPYWTRAGAVETVGDQNARAAASYRERWYQRAVVWQKASDLVGKGAHSNAHEDIGKISDLAIDPDAGRVMYGVLSFRGAMFAIPWTALTLSGGAERFVVNASKDQLTDSVSFGDDNWPNMIDHTWATQIHSHYSVQPYWVDVKVERGGKDDR